MHYYVVFRKRKNIQDRSFRWPFRQRSAGVKRADKIYEGTGQALLGNFDPYFFLKKYHNIRTGRRELGCG